ncbi:hypothetical protein ACFLS5_01080 [Candidatus Bipolaricaulota bacterium]
MRRHTALAAVLLLVSVAFSLTAGTLSGSTSLWIGFDPVAGALDAFDLGFAVDYTLGAVTLSTDGLLVLPGTWIWQGFSAVGRFGGYGLTTNVLFGPSTTDYLYAEAIAELSIGGIDVGWHAAQLSDAVLGGPADGWAVRVAGSVSGFEIVSISEFGARIEDEEFDGNTIVHAATGGERHYATDPLVPGQGFTGEKLSIRGLPFRCAELDATLYLTCAGFEYVSFGVTGIEVGAVPWLTFDVELTFELQTKSLALTPRLVLGEVACIEVYAGLDWDGGSVSIGGIGLYGIELVGQLGPVTVRDVTVFDLNRYAITTEAYGSVVKRLVDAIEEGHSYYPDYWEMLSIAYRGDGCCGQELTFLANAYFDEGSSGLFDWAMTHIEAEIPFGAGFSFTLGMEMHSAGVDSLAFGFHVDW